MYTLMGTNYVAFADRNMWKLYIANWLKKEQRQIKNHIYISISIHV